MVQTALIVVLLVAVIGNAILRVAEDRRYSREMANLMKANTGLRRMMRVWADTWGDPPEVVKAKLRSVMDEIGHD